MLAVPLMLAAGRWHSVTLHVGVLVLAMLVIANATIVGLALRRYPRRLPRNRPHLPLEDAALAIAAGAWLAHRLPRAGMPAPSLAGAAALTLVAAIAAAIVETYAVAHTG